MAKAKIAPEFIISRDQEKCIDCQVCCRVCSNDSHFSDPDTKKVSSDESRCAGCHFCESLCPTGALEIRRNLSEIKTNQVWTGRIHQDVVKQADAGGILLTGMGADRSIPIYFDHLLLNASQVTNPSIDPLREPMELRTYLGGKPDRLDSRAQGKGRENLQSFLASQIPLETPILFSAMSYGSISLNACKSLAMAAREMGILWNTGEGGLHQDLYEYGGNLIVQVASGRFGVHKDYLEAGAAIEIKIGQGAKPGIGGHLPGEKVSDQISRTRMIPEGTDALSPAPHHDIYSIEDLRQLIYALKEAVQYRKPVGVKIAAVHNVAPIASGKKSSQRT